MSQELHHGDPSVHRSRNGDADRYVWPDGLELTRYDDGRVKIGRKHNSVEVIDVMNRQRGGSDWGSAHVTARFRPAPDGETA